MSQYSELIGSFKRTGDFPLEANYMFADEAELLGFYEDELNATTQHNGLLKVVLDDGNGEQALYWCYTDDDGNYAWEKILDSTYQSQIDSLTSEDSDIWEALNKEILDRQDAVDTIYGTSNPVTIIADYNNITKIAEALVDINEKIAEMQEIIDGYATKEELEEAIEQLRDDILGDPEPTTEFQTLRGIEDFVRAMQSQMINTDTSLQKEIDDIETGVGLEADGSYSADASTNYLTEATSIMNALRILDSLIKENADAIAECVTEDKITEAVDELYDLIMGDPAPTTQFSTLRGIEDYVRELAAQVENTDTSLQDELDNTQTGIGLEADGSFSSDASTYYLTEATSIMNALRILDNELYEVEQKAGIVDNVTYDASTETITIYFASASGEELTVDFCISDIIREWDVNNEEGSAITLTRMSVIDGIDQLSADVNISDDDTNNLQNIDGELYVSNSSDVIVVGDMTLTEALSWHDVG